MNSQKTLYITDLDGTLLDGCSQVSQRSAAIISELSRKGVMISVATARTPATVDRLLSHAFTTIPFITFTGATMWDRTSRRYIDPQLIGQPVRDRILAILAAEGIHPFVYTIAPDAIIHSYYCGPISNAVRKFAGERSHLELKRMHINTEKMPGHAEPILIFALGPLESLQRAATQLDTCGCCSYSCYPDIFNPANGYLEIFDRGVSKASAVRKLKAMTGAERLVVFGDNLNDLPMMREADVAVAVANAFPQVKESADVIIGPNTADSVVLFIEKDTGIQL
ncbi:MAG: Cof-type HAD-IIB family hydrolase [Paramuribaculum sp.]|jgi:hypothetical protein